MVITKFMIIEYYTIIRRRDGGHQSIITLNLDTPLY